MFLDDERQRYTACKEWLRRGLGTKDQLARYRSFCDQYEASQQVVTFVVPPPETPKPSLDLPRQVSPCDNPPADLPPRAVFVEEHYEKYPSTVKAYSLLAFASILRQVTGGFRVWTLARGLDLHSSPNGKAPGKVLRSDLRDYLRWLGVSSKNQRRWIAAAIMAGFLRDAGDWLYYVSPAQVAYFLGVEKIGFPASVKAVDLVRRNWRAAVMVAYEAVRKMPMSQEKRAEVTGISPRCQRNYLNGRTWKTKKGLARNNPVEGITKRTNYAKTYFKPSEINYYRGEFGYHVFEGIAGIRQRLPDMILVPPEVSRTYSRRRSRIAQRRLNTLYCLPQGSGGGIRQFYDSHEAVVRAEKRAEKTDQPYTDIFKLQHVYTADMDGRNSNIWQTIQIKKEKEVTEEATF